MRILHEKRNKGSKTPKKHKKNYLKNELKTDQEQAVPGSRDFPDPAGHSVRVGGVRHRRCLPVGHPHIRRITPLILSHREDQRTRVSEVNIHLFLNPFSFCKYN